MSELCLCLLGAGKGRPLHPGDRADEGLLQGFASPKGIIVFEDAIKIASHCADLAL